MKTKNKKLAHSKYNKKGFLAPDSIRSMSAVHTKIKDDGIAILRISDCNNSIKIWNDFNSKEEKSEMLLKVKTLITHLEGFKEEIKSRIL